MAEPHFYEHVQADIVSDCDSGPGAKKVMQTALDMTQLCSANVTILSVVESEEDSDPAHPEQMSEEAVASLLAQAKKVFEQRGFSAETIARGGHPAFVICDVADEIGAELIVIGCRGAGLERKAKRIA